MKIMKSISFALILPISLLTLAGCDQFTQPPKPEPKAPVATAARPPIHRFTPAPNDFNVAFDTQTGEICRTWNWQVASKPAKPDPITGVTPPRQFGEDAPTCLSLYNSW